MYILRTLIYINNNILQRRILGADRQQRARRHRERGSGGRNASFNNIVCLHVNYFCMLNYVTFDILVYTFGACMI